MNVTTGIVLCHDMDFAIPWIPLHIHGFHWMDRQSFFSLSDDAVMTAAGKKTLSVHPMKSMNM